jgi:RNA polymerase sigma-70 factor (ECF subfamily)
VRAWLYRIAHNLALNAVTRSREVPTEEVFDDVLSATPEWHVLRQADITRVREAIASLPQALRTPLVLREYTEASYDEISDRLGLPLNTVRTRIHRARNALEAVLRQES